MTTISALLSACPLKYCKYFDFTQVHNDLNRENLISAFNKENAIIKLQLFTFMFQTISLPLRVNMLCVTFSGLAEAKCIHCHWH